MTRYVDHHMHSNFSPDAKAEATIENYIKKAKANGVSRLLFTDHMDFDSPVELFENLIDYDDYFNTIKHIQKATAIKLDVGVEIGYQPHLNETLNTFLNHYPFQFVIASIHVGDGLDFYNNDFFKGKTNEEAIKRYYEIVLAMVKDYDNYDVIGHLDYIIRYGNIKKETYDVKTYMPIIEAILKSLIAKNKGLELNTSGLRYGLGFIHPADQILKRYKALGGKIITLGSDAHDVNDYQADFESAVKKLQQIGIDEITEFKNRQPKQIKL